MPAVSPSRVEGAAADQFEDCVGHVLEAGKDRFRGTAEALDKFGAQMPGQAPRPHCTLGKGNPAAGCNLQPLVPAPIGLDRKPGGAGFGNLAKPDVPPCQPCTHIHGHCAA